VVISCVLAAATDARRKRTALSVAEKFASVWRDPTPDGSPPRPDESKLSGIDALRGHDLVIAELPQPWPAPWESRAVILAYSPEPVPGLFRAAGRAVVLREGRIVHGAWMTVEEFNENWRRQEALRAQLTAP